MSRDITITGVEVNLSASEWQLYTVSMDCTEAARALNKAASEALSCGDPARAYGIFSLAQNKWADFGAWDSEPRWEFERLHRRVFGEEED